jgi:flavorubredoxin
LSKILILYYSRTGNTERMAQAVAEGARTIKGTSVELTFHAEPEDLPVFDAIIVGDPTYHHDMTLDVKNLFEEAAVKKIDLKGKVGGSFGSYGWSGEAPRLVLEILQNKFAVRVIDPPLLAKYTPDAAALERCRAFGKKVAESLMHRASY